MFLKDSYDKPRQCIKKQRHHFANKGLYSQIYGLSNSHVQMWELDSKEGWAPKNWCLWTVLLEKTLESPLGCREIKPVNPKGNQSWIFIGRTDAEAEAPILCPPDVLIRADSWKRPWCWERLRAAGEGAAEDEMVGWYHWLNGPEFGQTPGGCEGWESLVWCSPWGGNEFGIVTEQQQHKIPAFSISSFQRPSIPWLTCSIILVSVFGN